MHGAYSIELKIERSNRKGRVSLLLVNTHQVQISFRKQRAPEGERTMASNQTIDNAGRCATIWKQGRAYRQGKGGVLRPLSCAAECTAPTRAELAEGTTIGKIPSTFVVTPNGIQYVPGNSWCPVWCPGVRYVRSTRYVRVSLSPRTDSKYICRVVGLRTGARIRLSD